MSAAGRSMVRNGELALVLGAAWLVRLDFDTPLHSTIMGQCLMLAAGLPGESLLFPGGQLFELKSDLTWYHEVCERNRAKAMRLRNWAEITSAQGKLRASWEHCRDHQFAAALKRWSGNVEAGDPPGDLMAGVG